MTISHHAGAPRAGWAARSERMSGGLTRRGFLLGAGAALATVGTPPGLVRTDLRAGVTAVPQPPVPPALPPRRVAPTLIGYGLVNAWRRVDPDWFAALLAANGLTLTEIEYVPWFDDAGRAGTSIRTDVGGARRLVAAMRRHDITTLISVVNWNGAGQRA